MTFMYKQVLPQSHKSGVSVPSVDGGRVALTGQFCLTTHTPWAVVQMMIWVCGPSVQVRQRINRHLSCLEQSHRPRLFTGRVY